MEKITFVHGIAMLLSMCGIVSMRMFLPVFLYILIVKFGIMVSWCPTAIQQLAGTTPEWMTSVWGISIFGTLAAAEILANWIDEVREFFNEDFDRYAKPVFAMVLAFSLLNADQVKQVQEVLTPVPVAQAGFTLGIFGALFCGAITHLLCRIRQKVISLFRILDPDNTLGVHTVTARTEETLCLILVLLVIFLPVFALILTGVCYLLSALFRKFAEHKEIANSHLCPVCNEKGIRTLVSNSAEQCQVCHAVQPEVCRLGTFGTATSEPLDKSFLMEHRHELLQAHRCPICAQPLKDPVECTFCHQKIWEAGYTQEEYAAWIDARALMIFLSGILLSLIPVIGFLTTVLLFNFMVIRPYRRYQTWTAKIKSKFLFRFLRILMLLTCAILAVVPFIGGLLSLLPFFLYYRRCRRDFMSRTSPEPKNP